MDTMRDYHISRWQEPITTVEATSVEEAAAVYARKAHTMQATALRTTGDRGLSGYFMAYVPIGHEGGWNSVGEPYHVRQA